MNEQTALRNSLMLAQRIGQRIEQRRGELNITKRELARRAGLEEARVNDYSAGKKIPEVLTLTRLGEALGVTVGYFVDD